MDKYKNLVKTFITSLSMSKPQDKKRKVMMVILSMFGVFGVLLPICGVIGIVMYILTEQLVLSTAVEAGLELMLHVICLCTVFFGINVVFTELYFSSDIEYLLPWPLRAYEIVIAKFTSTYISENVMQIMLVVSCFIGFFVSNGIDLIGAVVAIIGVLTIPVLPLVYCVIASILIMGLTRFIKRKETAHKLSLCVLILAVCWLMVSVGDIQNLDMSNIIEDLVNKEQVFVNGMNVVFPTIPLLVDAMVNKDIIALLIYIVISAVSIILMLVMSEWLYFKGVNGISFSHDKGRTKSIDELLNNTKEGSVLGSYVLKEIRILTRTPVYFTNCIMVNFLWPVFVYALYKIQNLNLSINDLREMYKYEEAKIQLIMLLGIIFISIIITAMNSLSSNAISREGKHFAFMKYIPVSYKVQWSAKIMVGIMFSLMGIMIYFVPVCVIMEIPVLHTLGYCLLSVFSITFISMTGMYIDSIQPKLIWDDELSALRENYNTFFAMAIAIGIAVVLCGGGYLLYEYCGANAGITGVVIGILLLIGNAIMWLITDKYFARNIVEQEEA